MIDKNNPIELRTSKDGSHTLYVKALDEHYHSVNGAIQESLHVFIQAGLSKVTASEINVLEFGFGTGLNVFLTRIFSENIVVYYHSMEKYPVDKDVFKKLNYGESYNGKFKQFFNLIHATEWNRDVSIDDNFILHKQQCDFKSVKLTQKYNLIYFDAFAPEVQPNLWTRDIFQKAFDALLPGGILTTYCAKGVVRRTMQEVGFKVERLPGPPGKREMIRASKL